MRLKTKLLCALALPFVAQLSVPAQAQWTNRYPKIAGASHHVYVEGYDLPTYAYTPTDPAASPDGKTLAFSARGWLWTMDVATRQARRLTRGQYIDSRPAWSPDGKRIAFVRDTSSDTTIMAVDVATGRETTLVDSKAMDLDPVFSPDGKTLFYSSAEAGDFDLWRLDLASGAKTRLTTDRGQELDPQVIDGGTALAFIARGRGDAITTLSLDGQNSRKSLIAVSQTPQMRLSASPDGKALASLLLGDDGKGWKLIVLPAAGGESIRLAQDVSAPQMPSWSTTGDIYFVQPNHDQQFTLYRTAVTGGPVTDMTPLAWDLGEATVKVTIRTRQGGQPVAARLAVLDGVGHPALPAKGMARFDNQFGRIYFHSPGTVELTVPAGALKVMGTHGFDGVAEVTRTVSAGQDVVIDLDLPSTGFNAQARGWYSGDLHEHLHYGGAYMLEPEDLVDMMRAEDLDVATTMVNNINTTMIDPKTENWERADLPIIKFSQEVRANLGHVGLIAAGKLFWPDYFGPGASVYSQLDITNGDALHFAQTQGGLSTYVHPVMKPNPFPADGGEVTGLPTEMVADTVMGDVDAIDIACVWSDELGSSDAWYRFLDLGLPIAATAGSDTYHNLFRGMAIGAVRVYGKVDGPINIHSYVDALRKGRTMVSTGPQLDFTVEGVGPGGVVAKGGQVDWKLDAYSPMAVKNVEILVNGKVVWHGDGPTAPGKKSYGGKITVPVGGWVAARAYGGPPSWPSQETYPFAHTSAVWFGKIGSSDPAVVRVAAGELLRALDNGEKRVNAAYPGDSGRRLKQRFADARQRLTAAASSGVFQPVPRL